MYSTCHSVCQALHGGGPALGSLHSLCQVGQKGGLPCLLHLHPHAALAVHGASRHLRPCAIPSLVSLCVLQPQHVARTQAHGREVWVQVCALIGTVGQHTSSLLGRHQTCENMS